MAEAPIGRLASHVENKNAVTKSSLTLYEPESPFRVIRVGTKFVKVRNSAGFPDA
jgi:hypothetical protein